MRDFSDQQGSLLLSRDVFVRYWNDDSVNVFRIYLQPGADGVKVRQQILDRYGTQQRLFVLTNQDLRQYVIRLTDQWFGLTYVQIAVAVLVAVLGIVNALTVSITDRRRELGVLQAVGGLRAQIRHTIWLEALGVGLIGLVLGLTLGAVQLYYSVEIARRDLSRAIRDRMRLSVSDSAGPRSYYSDGGVSRGSGARRTRRARDTGGGPGI